MSKNLISDEIVIGMGAGSISQWMRARIYFMSQDIQSLQKQFGKNLILNENLSKYSWFNLGGPAEIFFRPDNKEQLINFLIEVKKRNLSKKIIGA